MTINFTVLQKRTTYHLRKEEKMKRINKERNKTEQNEKSNNNNLSQRLKINK